MTRRISRKPHKNTKPVKRSKSRRRSKRRKSVKRSKSRTRSKRRKSMKRSKRRKSRKLQGGSPLNPTRVLDAFERKHGRKATHTERQKLLHATKERNLKDAANTREKARIIGDRVKHTMARTPSRKRCEEQGTCSACTIL